VDDWFRVFGTKEAQPEPAALLEFIRGLELGYDVIGKFTADDDGWFRAELEITSTAIPASKSAYAAIPLILERYLAKEEGIRAELNTWAAWLETFEQQPNHGWLMQHVISTRQLFTFLGPTNEDGVLPMEDLCLGLCQFLARETAGVYQVDNHGFYSPDGTLLLEEV